MGSRARNAVLVIQTAPGRRRMSEYALSTRPTLPTGWPDA
jgi:hypothetical protein